MSLSMTILSVSSVPCTIKTHKLATDYDDADLECVRKVEPPVLGSRAARTPRHRRHPALTLAFSGCGGDAVVDICCTGKY